MRIGLLHLPEKSWGGVYQYSLSLIDTLVKNDSANEYIVINASRDPLPGDTYAVAPPQQDGLFNRGLSRLYDGLLRISPVPLPILIPFALTRLGRWNRRENLAGTWGLDLVICSVPALHLDKLGVPYVMVIHDVMQRFDTREFSWKERTYRDIMYKRGAEGSVLTVMFSERGKADLHQFYGIPQEKVRVIPCIPLSHIFDSKDMREAEVDLLLKRFNLPDRYVFYPAHFWPHKNHASLVKALHLIRQKRGVEIPAVFVGFPREAFGAVMALVAKLGLGQQVFYLGYVTEKEIVALYRKAVAMVIPTLFELHSLPIVEALALETCCVASNSFSLPEQAEDAALLIDAQDPQDIADKIWRVWTDPTLRRELTSRGKRLVEEKYSRQAFVKQWLEVISDAAEICRSPARL